jgi:hypothetical protein
MPVIRLPPPLLSTQQIGNTPHLYKSTFIKYLRFRHCIDEVPEGDAGDT